MRQQRHQRGMARLTRHITRLENEVQQAMAVMDTDMGKLSTDKHGAFHQPTNLGN